MPYLTGMLLWKYRQVGVNNMQGKMITMDFDASGYAFILSSFLIILLIDVGVKMDYSTTSGVGFSSNSRPTMFKVEL